MPLRCAARGPPSLASLPKRKISPASGRTKPLRILTSVDLPAPFSPSSACTSPGRTASDTSSRATVAPKCFLSPTTSNADAPLPLSSTAARQTCRRRPCGTRARGSRTESASQVGCLLTFRYLALERREQVKLADPGDARHRRNSSAAPQDRDGKCCSYARAVPRASPRCTPQPGPVRPAASPPG